MIFSETHYFPGALLSNSPETILNIVDAREKFQESLCNLQESIKELHHQRESQRMCVEGETLGLPPSVTNELVKLKHCLDEIMGKMEKRESLGRHEPVPSAQLVCGVLECNTDKWTQVRYSNSSCRQ